MDLHANAALSCRCRIVLAAAAGQSSISARMNSPTRASGSSLPTTGMDRLSSCPCSLAALPNRRRRAKLTLRVDSC